MYDLNHELKTKRMIYYLPCCNVCCSGGDSLRSLGLGGVGGLSP